MLKSPLGTMQVLYYGDTYPKLPTGFRWFEPTVSWFPHSHQEPDLHVSLLSWL
jgi:hypothetical protein